MTATFAIWLAVGAALGAVHAWVIWRASQPPFHLAGAAMLRLLPVAAVFFAAAFLGGLIPTAAGWAATFFVCVAAIAFRKTA